MNAQPESRPTTDRITGLRVRTVALLLSASVATACASSGPAPASTEGDSDSPPIVQPGAPGEEARTFSPDELQSLTALALHGIAELSRIQREALAGAEG